MAQKKISELPLTKTMNNDDIFPIVQSGVTKQISYSDLKAPMVEEVFAAVSDKVDNTLSAIKRITDYSPGQRKIGDWNDDKSINRYVFTSDDLNSSAVVVNNQAFYGFIPKTYLAKTLTMELIFSAKIRWKNATSLQDFCWTEKNGKWCFHYPIFNSNVPTVDDVDVLIVEYVDSGNYAT